MWFIQGRLYQTNLMSFFDKRTYFLDKDRSVEIIYLDGGEGEAFDTVPHGKLLVKTGQDLGYNQGPILSWSRKSGSRLQS